MMVMRDPTAPDLNIELLTKVMEHIEAHPDEHDQSFWAHRSDCGTAFCFAGHAVNMTLRPDESLYWEKLDAPGVELVGATWIETDPLSQTYQPPVLISERAARVLGLTVSEASDLFMATNTHHCLREAVDRLIEAEQCRLLARAKDAG